MLLIIACVQGLVSGILNRDELGILNMLITAPFNLGLAFFMLRLAKQEERSLNVLFEGFQHYLLSLAATFFMSLFVILWMLLLIVPGIIAGLSYSLTYYIIAEEQSISARDAIRKSKEMMNGHKGQLFALCLRFILLSILCVFTLGIGFLWLMPYMNLCMTHFYLEVKES
ncbi:MAG: DUF975 family protein [Spirochaetales bacterium]|nr:DUF975 family protein [Spirochaetales bacterium]